METEMKGIKKFCSECKVENELREITLHLEKGDIKVEVTGVPAMVCPRCGQEYIPSSVSREVLEAADELAACLESTLMVSAGKPTERPVEELPFKSISFAVA